MTRLVAGFAIWICLVVSCSSNAKADPDTAPTDRGSRLSSSYEASMTSLYHFIGDTLAVGYGDFNGDGREDVVMAYVSESTMTTPVRMFLQDPDGDLVEDDSLLPQERPGTVHGRKVVVADFNSDGTPDIFIADHGYDKPPFPGARPVLLMSTGGRFEHRAIPDVPAGFQHSACAADLTGDGAVDIFVTDTTNGAFLLVNDGTGEFTATRFGIQYLRYGFYTSEAIDLDDDGYCDLIVAGHEQDGASTKIYWGDDSHQYGGQLLSFVPRCPDFPIVLDIDAEDLDGDGVREIVFTRTRAIPFYEGHYFQIIRQETRKLRDVSERVAQDRVQLSWRRRQWVPWIVLRDFDHDGDPDIVVPDSGRSLVYLNDGHGSFTQKLW